MDVEAKERTRENITLDFKREIKRHGEERKEEKDGGKKYK